MRILLDTHTFLWFLENNTKLSSAVNDLLDDPANIKILSIASPWEISIKVSIGRLSLANPFDETFLLSLTVNQVEVLPIEIEHLKVVATLPHHHRDPFDRLIIAQSLVEGLPILSIDAQFDAYGVQRIW